MEVNPSLWGPSFVYKETMSISGVLPVAIIGDPVEIVAFNANAPEPATTSLAAFGLAAAVLVSRRCTASQTSRDR